MKIIEQSNEYKLSVDLDKEEAARILEAFRAMKAIVIPEITWQPVLIFEFTKYYFQEDDKDIRMYYIRARQEKPNKIKNQ